MSTFYFIVVRCPRWLMEKREGWFGFGTQGRAWDWVEQEHFGSCCCCGLVRKIRNTTTNTLNGVSTLRTSGFDCWSFAGKPLAPRPSTFHGVVDDKALQETAGRQTVQLFGPTFAKTFEAFSGASAVKWHGAWEQGARGEKHLEVTEREVSKSAIIKWMLSFFRRRIDILLRDRRWRSISFHGVYFEQSARNGEREREKDGGLLEAKFDILCAVWVSEDWLVSEA